MKDTNTLERGAPACCRLTASEGRKPATCQRSALSAGFVLSAQGSQSVWPGLTRAAILKEALCPVTGIRLPAGDALLRFAP